MAKSLQEFTRFICYMSNSASWVLSLRSSQLIWVTSLPVSCCHLHSPSPFSIMPSEGCDTV